MAAKRSTRVVNVLAVGLLVTGSAFTMVQIRATCKHLILIAFFLLNMLIWWQRYAVDETFDNFTEYGTLYIVLYILRLLHRLPGLDTLANILGILFYNPFTVMSPETKETKNTHAHVFRVVTKGLNKNLVRKTVKRNIEIIKGMEMKNYQYEVVTSNFIGFEHSLNVREILVPEDYKPPNGSLFKGRVLHYCLNSEMNTLSDNDWIIHLDEETVMTESAVMGILEFTNRGEHDFGQGAIGYVDEEVVNWVTTFGDIYRTGVDYGCLRLSFNVLHIPFFNWKGSFIAAKASSEIDVGFDFGPEGSITEDCTFGMVAANKGYTFGFIRGYMLEQAPFTIMDFIHQRGRWNKGLILGVMLKSIPFKNKLGILCMILNGILRFISLPDMVLYFLFPLYFPPIIRFLIVINLSGSILTRTLGIVKSCDTQRYGYIGVMCMWMLSMICMPILTVMEACGMIAGLTSLNKIDFYSVVKESDKLKKTQ